jgi:hypothetical protein
VEGEVTRPEAADKTGADKTGADKAGADKTGHARKQPNGVESGSDFERPKNAPEGGSGAEALLKKKRKKAEGAEEEGLEAEKKKKVRRQNGIDPMAQAAQLATGPMALLPPKKMGIAQMAAGAGATAAAAASALASATPAGPSAAAPVAQLQQQQPSQQPPSARKLPPPPPYTAPRDVLAAVASLQEVVAKLPVPPPPQEGEKAPRKHLPLSLLEGLKAAQPLFSREAGQHPWAGKQLVDNLLSFMAPFTTRDNLKTHAFGKVRTFIIQRILCC